MKNGLSLAVVVRVLPLALPQRLEAVEDALVLLGELLEGHSGKRLFPHPVAAVTSSLLLHPVLQPKGSDLQRLPPDLSEVLLLRQCKLLDILGPFKQLDGSGVHAFFPLRRGEGVEVVEEELVLAEYHESLEEGVSGGLDVVVVVALHPLLDEVVVAMCGQHDAVTAVRHPPQALLDAGVGLDDGALLHLQHPPVRLQSLRLHQFVQRLANGQVLAVAEHEGGYEMVFLEGVGGVAEDPAVVAVEQGQFFASVAGATDDEGLVVHPPGAEVVGEELGDDEIDDVVIADGEDLRHLRQSLTLPVRIQLLLRNAQPQLLQLPTLRQNCSLEVVYEFHRILNYTRGDTTRGLPGEGLGWGRIIRSSML
jgi:hypothetical protein